MALSEWDVNRRNFLKSPAGFLGLVSLAQLLNSDRSAVASEPKATAATHFPAKAKQCIFVFLAGGLSQIDLFDPKPKLDDLHGQPVPDSMVDGYRFAFTDPKKSFLMRSPFEFKRWGKCGAEISKLLPHIASHADDLAIVRSMHHNAFAHAQAELMALTGRDQAGHPTNGAWLSYGLGCESQNLPAYVTLITGAAPVARSLTWGSGYLPANHAGVLFRNDGDPLLNLSNASGVSREARREQLDALAKLDQLQQQRTGDAAIESRIASYEMAYRMQMAAPELTDFRKESQKIHQLYGTDRPGDEGHFSRNCLLARRLVEKGVRFVSIQQRKWDHHKDLNEFYPSNCREVDQPVAALLQDLKQRGLLDSTLVVFATEFGRTPFTENVKPGPHAGRDHHPFAYSLWMAGGGVRGGQTIGQTDDFGWKITKDPVHLHDFHATMLHLFGMDHTRLTYRYRGLDHRLTEQAGKVVRPLIA
ncbi:MAG: DUF1501 domain-containing protein [Gemmataceae bacterium]